MSVNKSRSLNRRHRRHTHTKAAGR